jgi:hypothetical protein
MLGLLKKYFYFIVRAQPRLGRAQPSKGERSENYFKFYGI